MRSHRKIIEINTMLQDHTRTLSVEPLLSDKRRLEETVESIDQLIIGKYAVDKD